MTTLRGAIIGCGYIAQQQLRAWSQIDGAEIVAVCDLDEAKARSTATRFDIDHWYVDPSRMLDDLDLDFVDIATRPKNHPDLTQTVARRGLAVLCQKPMAMSLAEARSMVEVCDEHGVTLMVNENFRFQSWFRKIGEILTDGTIGSPYYARFEARARASLPQPHFVQQPYFADMPQLMLFEMGVHFIDTARSLFGEAASVYASTRRLSQGIAGEDYSLAILRFDGMDCVIDCNWCGVPEPSSKVSWGSFRLEGTAGTAILRQDGVLQVHSDHGSRSWAFPPSTIEDSFTATQEHFVACLRRQAEPETSGRQSLRTMALLFAAYESAGHGEVVQVDVQA